MATVRKKRTKKGAVKKTNGRTGNAGRSSNAFHPFWIWQLLRRNEYYIKAVDDFVSSVEHDDSLFNMLISGKVPDQLVPDGHSILYEHYLDVSNQYSGYPIKDIAEAWLENIQSTLSNEFEENYLSLFPDPSDFQAKAIFPSDLKLKDYEITALSRFQALFGSVIMFPLNPSVGFPTPDILANLITAYPSKIIVNGPLHEMAVKNSRNLQTIQVNLGFSNARIRDQIMKTLSSMTFRSMHERFVDINDSWATLGQKLLIYDSVSAGKEIAELTKQIYGSNSSNHKKQIQTALQSVKNMISLLDPEILE